MTRELKEYKAKKAKLRGQLTRFSKYLEQLDPDNMTDCIVTQLKMRVANIEPSLAEFNETLCKIETEQDEIIELIEDERIKFETDYYETVSKARTLLESFNTSAKQVSGGSHIPEPNRAIQLPTISIPNFDGSYENWYAFHDTYKSLIHNNNTLAAIQKFHYLRSAFVGEAASVVQALEITEQNYPVAWNLLIERYENKKLITQKHLKALFNVQSINRESANDIRNLIDTVQKHLRALEALGEPTNHWDTLMIHLIMTKCDKYTIKEWETQSQKIQKPLLKDLISFLNNKSQVLEVINKEPTVPNRSLNQRSKTVTLVAHAGTCPNCQGKHNLYSCEQFVKMPMEEKRQAIKKLKVCYNCLRSNHRVADCKAGVCRHCNKKHHTLLCYEKKNQSEERKEGIDAVKSNKANDGTSTGSSHVSMSSTSTTKQTLLATAIINVFDHSGRSYSARALLDPASHCNFITEELCNRLKLKARTEAVSISGIGQLEAQTKRVVTVVVKSRYNAYKQQLDFLLLPKITENLPIENFDDKEWNIPKTIKLADEAYNKSTPIDILIGADIFWDLLCVGQIKLGQNMPILHKTQLGWVVGGPLPWHRTKQQSCNVSLQQISHQIKQFWEIEDNLQQKALLSSDENACVEIFENNTIRANDGKFVIRIPLKHDRAVLGNSKDMAKKRFYQLERKLAQNEELKRSYVEFMREYEHLKHMEDITTQETNKEKQGNYYIPHHAIIKDTSLTTKTRVVFDASAKTDKGISLNDIMLVGPRIQPELFEIIIQFRTYKIGLIADIEKMYRMIWVHSEDRELQQIFWRESPEEPVKTYQLCTLTYGTAAASFIATKVLYEIAEREKQRHPDLEGIIKSCFYMDDLICGAETVEEALNIKTELCNVLGEYGLNLRKWCSSNETLRKMLNEDDEEFGIINISNEQTIKTLGLVWNPSKDCFQYQVKENIETERITKRSILSRGLPQMPESQNPESEKPRMQKARTPKIPKA